MRINRRTLVLIVLAALCAVNLAWASEKKGICLAELQMPERIETLNVAWYYTWQPQPVEGIPAEKFVPMVWGGYRLEKHIHAIRSQGKVPVLLAINEPNKTDQANMSVEEVIRIWPTISELTDRISTPATAGVLNSWFDKFYRMARARGLKMDFMAVHLYGPPDAAKFLKKIDSVYQKYHMPIWITEFAVADWEATDKGTNRYDEDQVLSFMKAVLPELEKRPYVVRYAWFGAGRRSVSFEPVRTSRLFEKDGTLTPLGRYYAEFDHPPGRQRPGL
jgi:hypothetical protein